MILNNPGGFADEADFVVVGSGAGGASAAYTLASAGRSVLVLEEGPPPQPAAGDAREALAALYRDGGARAAIGPDPLPLLQGRCVGGTTVINGGIQVPFPEPVWREWAADAAWARRLPWAELEAARERMDALLVVASTPPPLWGRNGGLMRAAFGDAAHPTRRNTPGCAGSGRCLQGCPHGGKRSVDRVLLGVSGLVVRAGARVSGVTIRGGVAEGVWGKTRDGAPFTARARRGVLLAAGAIDTPWLLLRSGIRGAGRGFCCHPGAAMAGLFAEPVFGGAEATQSMEVLAHLGEGLKFESLGMPRAFRAARVPGVGATLARRLERLDDVALWGVAVRSDARGRVVRGPFGPLVLLRLSRRDRVLALRGLAMLAEAMLRVGAVEIWPAVYGAPERVTEPAAARALADLEPSSGVVPLVATHLFGGTPLGEGWEVAGVRRLYAADASIFPTNLGVNPMSAILSVASVLASRLA